MPGDSSRDQSHDAQCHLGFVRWRRVVRAVVSCGFVSKMKLLFSLPYPPSMNCVWRFPNKGKSAGRVLLSEPARVYRQAVADEVLVQGVRRYALIGRLGMTIEVHAPNERIMDLGNCEKAVCDALQKCAVIRNDADIDELHILRREVVPGGKLNIIIWELTSCETTSSPCARASRAEHLDRLAGVSRKSSSRSRSSRAWRSFVP